eukprot:m.172369 g.172369  ORF g.172369 m.172369 type:complete len:598 (-) comp15297_c6_seq14:60-1853(-)
MEMLRNAIALPFEVTRNTLHATLNRVGEVAWTVLKYLLLAFIVFHVVLGCAIIIYSLFYYFYVPVPLHTFPVYFDYSGERPATHFPLHPHARALLQANQEYDVKLWMLFPESETNINAGVFMVDLLLTHSQHDAEHLAANVKDIRATPGYDLRLPIRRPVMLFFRSRLTKLLRTALLALCFIAGVADETQAIEVEMLPKMMDNSTSPYTWVGIALSSPSVHVAQARLEFHAHLSGLQYLMFHWFFSSFVVGVACTAGALLVLVVLPVTLAVLLARPEPQPIRPVRGPAAPARPTPSPPPALPRPAAAATATTAAAAAGGVGANVGAAIPATAAPSAALPASVLATTTTATSLLTTTHAGASAPAAVLSLPPISTTNANVAVNTTTFPSAGGPAAPVLDLPAAPPRDPTEFFSDKTRLALSPAAHALDQSTVNALLVARYGPSTPACLPPAKTPPSTLTSGERPPTLIQHELEFLQSRAVEVTRDAAFADEEEDCVYWIRCEPVRGFGTLPPVAVTVPSAYPSVSPVLAPPLPPYEMNVYFQNVWTEFTRRVSGLPQPCSLAAVAVALEEAQSFVTTRLVAQMSLPPPRHSATQPAHA